MARPYISVGAGGPRVGVVLGRRDMAGMAKFFVIFAAIIIAIAALAGAGNGDPVALAIVAVITVAAIGFARRPYIPPMTPAEQEAIYQAAKAEFNGG